MCSRFKLFLESYLPFRSSQDKGSPTLSVRNTVLCFVSFQVMLKRADVSSCWASSFVQKLNPAITISFTPRCVCKCNNLCGKYFLSNIVTYQALLGHAAEVSARNTKGLDHIPFARARGTNASKCFRAWVSASAPGSSPNEGLRSKHQRWGKPWVPLKAACPSTNIRRSICRAQCTLWFFTAYECTLKSHWNTVPWPDVHYGSIASECTLLYSMNWGMTAQCTILFWGWAIVRSYLFNRCTWSQCALLFHAAKCTVLHLVD